MQATERDALLAAFESVQRRWREAELPGEFGERLRSTGASEKLRKLFVQSTGHSRVLMDLSFRMRNIFRIWNRTCMISDAICGCLL